MEHLNHPYRAHKMQPWIVIVVGRRGMGKTHTARAICRSWKESRDKDGLILAVDSVSSSPPAAHHLASESDVYSSHMMDIICLLYTSPSPRDYAASRMPSSA